MRSKENPVIALQTATTHPKDTDRGSDKGTQRFRVETTISLIYVAAGRTEDRFRLVATAGDSAFCDSPSL